MKKQVLLILNFFDEFELFYKVIETPFILEIHSGKKDNNFYLAKKKIC